MAYKNIDFYVREMESYHHFKQRHICKVDTYNHHQYLNIDIFLKWCNQNNIKHYDRGKTHWSDLKPGKRYDGSYRLDNIPLYDHSCMFKTQDKKMILTVQPYTEYIESKEIELSKIINFCKERGLEVIISKELSWYYPGATTLFQYSIKDIEKFKDFMNNNKYARGYFY